MTSKRHIVCLGSIDWSFLFHRPQQLMLFLARQGHPVHYRNPSQVYGIEPEEVALNLWVYTDFDRVPRQDIRSAIYVVYFPAHAAWLDPGAERFVIYDCLDDFPGFTEHERLLLTRADLVLCCSQKLLEKQNGKHPHLMFLPNGVDIDHYHNEGLPAPPEMDEIRSTGEAVVGFTGAFNTGWVDTELIYRLAEARPQWQFVIIGANYAWSFSQAPPNIHYLGTRSYEYLPAYVHGFDIGLIPFRDNAISQAADPVKLYEYIAAGLPVVSRNLPFVRGFSRPVVYPYGDFEGCLTAIDQALSDKQEHGDEVLRQRRRGLARTFSWDRRFHPLLAILKEMTWL